MRIFYKKQYQKEYEEITQKEYEEIKNKVEEKNFNEDELYHWWYLDLVDIKDNEIYVIEMETEVI